MNPASWRYNNAGAMYPGPISRKWGSTGHGIIGAGHKIAQFDDPTKGAAAQFDLLGSRYVGLPLGEAIRKWSGGNSSDAYAQRVSRETGIGVNDVLTEDHIRNPATAVPFAKTMAAWEGGKPYPMPDEQWQQAHRMYLGGGGAINTSASKPDLTPSPQGQAAPQRETMRTMNAFDLQPAKWSNGNDQITWGNGDAFSFSGSRW